MTVIQDPWKILAAPFPFEEIEIKPQTMTKDNTKALAVAYFDARAAQSRLDDAFGPMAWSFETKEISKGIIGRLTVTVDGLSTVREDGSEYTDIEALKGAISGAFKRCFSALGNRTLYEVDLGWQPCKTYDGGQKPRFDGWTTEAMSAMKAKYEKQLGISRIGQVKQPESPAPFAGEVLIPQSEEAVDYMKKTCEFTSSEFAALKNNTPRGSDYRLVLLEAKKRGLTSSEDIIRLVNPNYEAQR